LEFDDAAVPTLRHPRYSQSFERGLAILTTFSASRPTLGIADMADALGMSRSTTHRYAITLVSLGFLEQLPSRKYRLGPRVTDVGMAALGAVAPEEAAMPELERLRARTGHTVGMSVLDRLHVTYVRRLPGRAKGQYRADLGLCTGAHLPLVCSASGKALLAALPEEESREIISALSLLQEGPNAILSKRALSVELERIRQDGIALSDEELAAGVRAIAAPLPAPLTGNRFAVEVNVPTAAYTVKQLRHEIGPLVVAAARNIVHEAGAQSAC
jgi:IclR family pca regulon transcriptional regulator